MKIADGIEMLELTIDILGRSMVIYPTVIHDSHSYVLVDTGMPSSHKEIIDLIRQSGIEASEPHSIILTHQDLDHIGGLPQFIVNSSQQVNVYAHEDDKSYINGELPFLKLPLDIKHTILQSLPEKHRLESEAAFSNSTPTNVSHVVTEGERLPFGGGLEVIHTPGHTPGHICLYHEPSKTLIAGDALLIEEGQLMGPKPENTPNMDEAIRSLQKLKDFEIDSIICYHGGVFRGDIPQRINELTSNQRKS
ncbi:MBL fold metallo-hydrolase [Paenibacillus alginolyticus]|nr:MBL fold metallo-hydrolase [Paenibacillus alginolyticus]MEC0148736.1 MBL fold metallo-hydrolase [Paenibacillus alginolyticus]